MARARAPVLCVQATDEAVQGALEASGLSTVRHATYLLHEPADVRIDMGQWCGHFGTLTPFHRHAPPQNLLFAGTPCNMPRL